MSKWRKWFYRNFDFVRACGFWLVVVVIVFSAGATGYFGAWVIASSRMADQRDDYVRAAKGWQDANAALVQIIRDRLPEITSTVDSAAKTAKEAADVAKDAADAASGAGTTARRAASTARSAANSASEAAADVKEVVTPRSSEPKEPPTWLGGP